MNPWVFLWLWIGSHVAHLVLGVVACLQRADDGGRKRHGSLILSACASVIPVITLLLFLRVFVIGRSSNVAQLAGDDGYDLWRLWFKAWPLLLLANPVSMVAALVAACLPPYSIRGWPSHVSRACAVIAAVCACYVVMKYFPDA